MCVCVCRLGPLSCKKRVHVLKWQVLLKDLATEHVLHLIWRFTRRGTFSPTISFFELNDPFLI